MRLDGRHVYWPEDSGSYQLAMGMGAGSVLDSFGTWGNIPADSFGDCCHRGEID